MAKERGYFPRELFHKTDRLPRRRCPTCGYTHQAQDEVCEVCREKAPVKRPTGVGEGLQIVKPRPVRENAEASHDSPPCEHDLTDESEALIGME
jgi:hypothetical protein